MKKPKEWVMENSQSRPFDTVVSIRDAVELVQKIQDDATAFQRCGWMPHCYEDPWQPKIMMVVYEDRKAYKIEADFPEPWDDDYQKVVDSVMEGIRKARLRLAGREVDG